MKTGASATRRRPWAFPILILALLGGLVLQMTGALGVEPVRAAPEPGRVGGLEPALGGGGGDLVPAFNGRAFYLTVSLTGSGGGTVKSSIWGIDCGSDCKQLYRVGREVQLAATPNSGSTFAGWGGACSGTSPTCTVRMDADRQVSAIFSAEPGPGPTDGATALTGPYNFTLSPGQQVSYDIKFGNSGGTTWTTAAGYALKNTVTDNTFALGDCDGLQPGWSCTWGITLTAGSTPGTYTFRYRMHHDTTAFGDEIVVTFAVGGGQSARQQSAGDSGARERPQSTTRARR